jgi:hypothetical protein
MPGLVIPSVVRPAVPHLNVRRSAREEATCAFINACEDSGMTREQVESALASGLPFTLLMADGKEYPVPHRDYISLPPKASYVMVYDDSGHFTVLPLLTMTGLHSRIADASTQDK